MSDKHLLCTPQQVEKDVRELACTITTFWLHAKCWGEKGRVEKHDKDQDRLYRLARLAREAVRMKGKP